MYNVISTLGCELGNLRLSNLIDINKPETYPGLRLGDEKIEAGQQKYKTALKIINLSKASKFYM